MTDPIISISLGSLTNVIAIGTACTLTAFYVKRKVDSPRECLEAIKKRVDVLYIVLKLEFGHKIDFDSVERDVNKDTK